MRERESESVCVCARVCDIKNSASHVHVCVFVCVCVHTLARLCDLWVRRVSDMCMNATVQVGSGAKLEEAYRESQGCPKGFSKESPEKPMWLDHRAKCERNGTQPMTFSRFVLSLSRVSTSYCNS